MLIPAGNRLQPGLVLTPAGTGSTSPSRNLRRVNTSKSRRQSRQTMVCTAQLMPVSAPPPTRAWYWHCGHSNWNVRPMPLKYNFGRRFATLRYRTTSSASGIRQVTGEGVIQWRLGIQPFLTPAGGCPAPNRRTGKYSTARCAHWRPQGIAGNHAQVEIVHKHTAAYGQIKFWSKPTRVVLPLPVCPTSATD